MAGELFSDRATNESHTCQIWQILVGCAARRETLCGSFRTMPLVQAQA